jgi:hypothetical protein
MPYYKGRVVVHGIDRAFGCPAANLDEAKTILKDFRDAALNENTVVYEVHEVINSEKKNDDTN